MDKTIKISENAYKKLTKMKLSTNVPIKHIINKLLKVNEKDKNDTKSIYSRGN